MSGTPEADRLKQSRDYWEAIRDNVPIQLIMGNSQDVSASTVSDWLNLLVDAVARIEAGSPDLGLMGLHWQGISQQITLVGNVMETIRQNGATPPIITAQIPALFNHMWGIRSAIPWLLPLPESKDLGLAHPLLSELAASAEVVFELRRKVTDADDDFTRKLQAFRDESEKASKLLTEIEGYERTAGNAQTNAEANASGAKQTNDALAKLLQDMSSDAESLRVLLDHFVEQKIIVDETLEGASKVALANSFQTRRKSLSNERWGWVAAFVAGLAAMTLIGVFVVPRALGEISTGSPSGYLNMIGHFLILAPAVWLTWFAARKSGQTSRLTEDYAFKEAAAHAFVGYKREMGEDKELLHMLQEYAIKNFGADPLRVLSGDEAASPLHDVVSKVLNKLDKLKPEEMSRVMLEFAKALK